MDEVNFKIEKKRSKEWPLWVIALILFIINTVICISLGNPFYMFIGMVAITLIHLIIFKFYPYQNLIGNIKFGSDRLEVIKQDENIVFAYNDITSIDLTYTQKRGLYYRHIDLGNDNVIELKTENAAHQFFICIPDTLAEEKLKSALCNLYLNGVVINETVHEVKTYGLEQLNYEQIQLFKEKYSNPE